MDVAEFEVVLSRLSHTEFLSIPWVYGQLVTSEPAQQRGALSHGKEVDTSC